MLMPNLGRFVRLCVRLTILDLLKVYMNMFLRFFRFKFFKFLNRLCIYGSNGLWSGATPISDGIFSFSLSPVSIETFDDLLTISFRNDIKYGIHRSRPSPHLVSASGYF